MAGAVITVGEMLIDFSASDTDVALEQATSFQRNPGGAPANVAVAVARLGGHAAFIGVVGNDPFGRYLHAVLDENGVDTQGVSFTDQAATSLAFVATHKGEPDYFFVRQPGADALLTPEAVRGVEIHPDTIIHFGSNSLAQQPIRLAMEQLVSDALVGGGMISFDVNLRPAFWERLEDARTHCLQLIPHVQLLKVNRAELAWLTEEQDIGQGLRVLAGWTQGAILCTLGADGAAVVPAAMQGDANRAAGADTAVGAVLGGTVDSATSTMMQRDPIYIHGFATRCIDTTGAGDAFAGAILFQLASAGTTKANLSNLTPAQWTGYARFACAAAGYSITRQGAISSLPTLQDVRGILG